MKTFKIIVSALFILTFNFTLSQQQSVSGTVNSNGIPIPGVNVLIKGSNLGTSTDFDGNYRINCNSSNVLVFTYIGYKTQEIVVGTDTIINVELEEELNELDEIVLVGYGNIRKKDLTGAVSVVKGEELSKRTVTSIQESLAGQLPGIQVSSGGGTPGAEASITVRGFSTLNDNTPLYVVDDVPLDDISFLSPNDVENIQVLKDASASAIFGSRASNGVIIISTKKAKVNKTTVSLDISSSMQSVAKKPNMADAAEYVNIKNAARINDGDSPLYTDPSGFGTGTDWWDEVTQVALLNNVALNISKGSEQLKLSSGFTYQSQEGIQKGGDYEKIAIRLNTEYKLLDNLTLGENFSIGKSATTNGPQFLLWDAYRLEPITDPYIPDYEQSSDLNEFSVFSPTVTDVPNALGQLARNFNQTDYLSGVGSVYLDWEMIKGLSFKTQFSVYFSSYENNWFAPDYFIEETDKQIFNSVGRTHNNRTNTTWNNVITYSKDINNHNFKLMGGIIVESLEHRTLSAQAENIPSNHPDLRYLDAATQAFFSSGNNENYNLISYLGRLNYAFKEKYLLTATLRVDGSSLFPEGNKWGKFPSVSGAWVISDEDFMTDSAISYLKLRVGWGQIGNDNRNSLPADARLTTIANDYYTTGLGQSLIIGAAPGNVGNPDLKWETVEDINLGIDMNLFENKLGLNLDVFKRKTYDMLMAKSIPSYIGSGFDAQWANIGNFETQGADLGINFKTQIGNVKSNFNLNVSHYTAKATKLADGETIWDGNHQRLDLLGRTAEGQTPGLFYGYVTDGIFQNKTEINSHSDEFGNIIQPVAQPGDFRFKDLDGDGQLTDSDRKVIGDPTPDFTFGFKMLFEYKGFDFNALFTGSYGNDMMNGAKPYLANGGEIYNSYAGTLVNSWNGEGSTNSQPRLTVDDPNGNFRYSDYYIEDGSYLRLKNVQIGFNFSDTIINKLGLAKARIYASAENVFTLTSFSGLDPDVSGWATLRGLDWGHYPLPRIVSFGLNLTF